MTEPALTAKQAGEAYSQHMAMATDLEQRAGNCYKLAQDVLNSWAKQEASAAGIHTGARLRHKDPKKRDAKPTGRMRILGFRGNVVTVDDNGDAVLAVYVKLCPQSVSTDVIDKEDEVFFVKLGGLLADYEKEEAA